MINSTKIIRAIQFNFKIVHNEIYELQRHCEFVKAYDIIYQKVLKLYNDYKMILYNKRFLFVYPHDDLRLDLLISPMAINKCKINIWKDSMCFRFLLKACLIDEPFRKCQPFNHNDFKYIYNLIIFIYQHSCNDNSVD